MNIDMPVVLEIDTASPLVFPPDPFRVRFSLAYTPVGVAKHLHDVPVSVCRVSTS